MGTKKIEVAVQTGMTPKVRVDGEVWGKKKIEWVRDLDGSNVEFTFVDVKFDKSNAPVTNIQPSSSGKKVTADNDTSKKGKWEYTVYVKAKDGTQYDSDTKASGKVARPPNPDKPVIRN